MIIYWNLGKRQYGVHPIPIHRRVGWEFQWFREGSCRLTFVTGSSLSVEPGSLWVFPPSTPHGWEGEPDSECEIRVAHFSRVQEPLGVLGEKKRYLVQRLTREEMEKIEPFFLETGAAYKSRSYLLNIYAERLLLELTLCLLPAENSEPSGGALSEDEQIVASAVSYFREHMHEGISVYETAKAVYVSPSHFRRLFHKVLGRSPREFFEEERLQRVEEMLRETNSKIDQIADACGFESAGTLIRFFRQRKGVTPAVYRKGRG
jgi:AraC-like DNA-binding protein